jgi:hypothetical protein
MKAIYGVLWTAVVLAAAAALGQSKSPEDESTYRMTLYPAAEPRPALKYQLLPPFLERRPGNAAVWWNRIPAERHVFFDSFDKEFQEGGRIDTWMNLPIGDPREKEYRLKELAPVLYLLTAGGIYDDMERAARFESCDWQLPVREGNFIAVLLPEMQQSRGHARVLCAKAHLEIAEGHYDQAVRTLQTGYAEARAVAQGQFVVSSLVGVTIAGIMSYQVQQFIQQPDAPNLYWALSTLPRPLVDFRPAIEAESNMLYLQYPELRDLDKKNLSPDEWRALLARVVAETQRLQRGSSPSAASPVIFALDAYPTARRVLIERGRTAAEVEAMPVAQAVLLYAVQRYDELSGEQAKWCLLPAVEAGDRPGRRSQPDASDRAIVGQFFDALIFAAQVAKRAETRCQWVVARLRICEAMRLYAAGHDGRWPNRLSEITEVPIPTNPCDGKPFTYERHGDRAVLSSETHPWPGEPWRYEITLMPKTK